MNKKVLLINMPWGDCLRPSVQVGILTAYLLEQGIEVENKYFNLKLAQLLGVELYLKISQTSWHGYYLYAPMLADNPGKSSGSDSCKENSALSFPLDKLPLADYHDVDFPEVMAKIKEFHSEILSEIEYGKYDIIGFTNGFQQTIPSLSVAKYIKEHHPEILLVFGGSSCYAELGETLLKTYDFLDVVVSGEGEEALLEIVHRFRSGEDYEHVAGTYCRKNGQIFINTPRPLMQDLNKYPYPNFDAYFAELPAFLELYDYSYYNNIVLPIEGSRGCWWKKCAFCGLNRQFIENETHTYFRPKSVARIVAELDAQRRRYHMEHFTFTDCINFKIAQLAEEIIQAGTDYSLTTECRVDLPPHDFYLMKKAGFGKIQLGIESFSTNLLRKMNKGVTALQNINALKWCKIFDIYVNFNIIKNFPLEAKEDVREMITNMKKISHLMPPARISTFRLDYQSLVYQKAEEYNVCNIRTEENFAWVYGEEWTKLAPMSFAFDHITPLETTEEWAEVERVYQAWLNAKGKKLIYFDAGSYLKIIDTRFGEVGIGIVDEREREVYLYCNFVRTFEQLKERFLDYGEDYLQETLTMFVSYNMMIEENGAYLSLALPAGEQGRERLIREVVE